MEKFLAEFCRYNVLCAGTHRYTQRCPGFSPGRARGKPRTPHRFSRRSRSRTAHLSRKQHIHAYTHAYRWPASQVLRACAQNPSSTQLLHMSFGFPSPLKGSETWPLPDQGRASALSQPVLRVGSTPTPKNTTSLRIDPDEMASPHDVARRSHSTDRNDPVAVQIDVVLGTVCVQPLAANCLQPVHLSAMRCRWELLTARPHTHTQMHTHTHKRHRPHRTHRPHRPHGPHRPHSIHRPHRPHRQQKLRRPHRSNRHDFRESGVSH